jgi:hypothetical protein
VLTAAPLSTIIALARAGALDHAWAQFAAGGYDRDEADPAALTVKGRLLKDYALRSAGDERRHFYLRSADCYRRAAAVQPGTYPLINAASLSLLSGNRAQAKELAREVLERIGREPDEPETPYWRAATEAEALVLLGRAEEARTALAAALAAAPQAWEDHASTLRQFIAIHEALGADPGWLDLLRPPRSLFYSGRHLAALPDGALAALLEEEAIGFGYGGLAAGSELVVAEALLARGAQLHVVLPGDAAGFAAALVDPHGADWRARFDAALAAAESVEYVRPLDTAPDARLAALAEEIALGAAMLNAERLMGEAVALRVGEGPDVPFPMRTRQFAVPAGAGALAVPPAPAESRLLQLALLAISVGSGGEAGFEDRLEDIEAVLRLADGAVLPAHLSGDCILIGYAEPAAAAAAARAIHARLRGAMPLRVAGHYGLVAAVRDPFSGSQRSTERGAEIVRAIAGAIPPDTLCVSHDFAAALAARAGAPGAAAWIGELQALDGGSAIGLYALAAQG